jgi:hypothetical protein
MNQSKMNQPSQQDPNKGTKQGTPSSGQRSTQQTQQGSRTGQGGYSSPGQPHHGSQSAPSEKK